MTNDVQPCQICCDSSQGRFLNEFMYAHFLPSGSWCQPDKQPACAICPGLITGTIFQEHRTNYPQDVLEHSYFENSFDLQLRYPRFNQDGVVISSKWKLGLCSTSDEGNSCLDLDYELLDRGTRIQYASQVFNELYQRPNTDQVATYFYQIFNVFDDEWFSNSAYEDFVERKYRYSQYNPPISYEKDGQCLPCTQCTPPLYVNNCGGNGHGPGECQSCSVGKKTRKNVAEIQRCLQKVVYYDWEDANHNVFEYELAPYTGPWKHDLTCEWVWNSATSKNDLQCTLNNFRQFGMWGYSDKTLKIDGFTPFNLEQFVTVEDCWCVECGPCDPGFERTGCSGHNDGSCTLCADGYFKQSPNADSCSPCLGAWDDCPAGEYVTQACGGANGQVCSPCPLGYFKPNAGMHDCTVCSPCADGYYESAPCTRTTNRVCAPCPGCADNEFIIRSCSDYLPTVCVEKSCRQCQSGSSLVPGSCTGTINGQCECIAGYYEVGIVDTTFTECVPCPANSFKLEAGNHNCTWCDECGTGIDHTACQKQCECYDTSVCDWCPSNQYKPTFGHPACQNCTTCGSNEYETVPCTLYSNRQCAPCSTCAADEIQSFACSAYFNTGCYDYHLFCRRCGVGELLQGCTVDSPGECFCLPGYTRNAQGVCTACPDAWYKATVGNDPCLPCSFCVDDNNKHCESVCTCTASTDFNPLTCPNDCQNAISLDTCPENQAHDDSYTCVCTVGYELKDGACSPCPHGHVKYTVGNTACVESEGCDMADSIECDTVSYTHLTLPTKA